MLIRYGSPGKHMQEDCQFLQCFFFKSIVSIGDWEWQGRWREFRRMTAKKQREDAEERLHVWVWDRECRCAFAHGSIRPHMETLSLGAWTIHSVTDLLWSWKGTLLWVKRWIWFGEWSLSSLVTMKERIHVFPLCQPLCQGIKAYRDPWLQGTAIYSERWRLAWVAGGRLAAGIWVPPTKTPLWRACESHRGLQREMAPPMSWAEELIAELTSQIEKKKQKKAQKPAVFLKHFVLFLFSLHVLSKWREKRMLRLEVKIGRKQGLPGDKISCLFVPDL